MIQPRTKARHRPRLMTTRNCRHSGHHDSRRGRLQRCPCVTERWFFPWVGQTSRVTKIPVFHLKRISVTCKTPGRAASAHYGLSISFINFYYFMHKSGNIEIQKGKINCQSGHCGSKLIDLVLKTYVDWSMSHSSLPIVV